MLIAFKLHEGPLWVFTKLPSLVLINITGKIFENSMYDRKQCSNENEQYDPPEIRTVRIIGT